ncbi:MAG: hypothetical protein C0505_19065, partial [Leptothrix sp. (in: Bacteria)]|nr:hypothetical protein [Leptothrix sp. (in: b-proteobacteria)]
MLLGVWLGDAAGIAPGWRSRMVLPDARTLEFDSPFEPAHFASRVQRRRADAGPDAGRLRRNCRHPKNHGGALGPPAQEEAVHAV